MCICTVFYPVSHWVITSLLWLPRSTRGKYRSGTYLEVFTLSLPWTDNVSVSVIYWLLGSGVNISISHGTVVHDGRDGTDQDDAAAWRPWRGPGRVSAAVVHAPDERPTCQSPAADGRHRSTARGTAETDPCRTCHTSLLPVINRNINAFTFGSLYWSRSRGRNESVMRKPTDIVSTSDQQLMKQRSSRGNQLRRLAV